MTSRAGTAQVIVAYEVNGLTPYQISVQLDMDIGEVEAILFEFSKPYKESVYGRNVDSAPGQGSEYEELKRQYKHLAEFSTNDTVKERALQWLMNEARGRNDIPERHLKLKERLVFKEELDLGLRVAKFNADLQAARKHIADAMKEPITV